MKKKYLFIIIILFAFSSNAQELDSLPKPKIGLVLSGGGAKGLAHIGVLKTLEKYHIRPDFIAGTSMGAIVGSLYASGYSAKQIDSLFRAMDFDAIMYNTYDRKYKYFFNKERGKKYILTLPFSINKMSAQLPRGLSNSQKMFSTMADKLLHIGDVNNFSKLNIPFVCVATDITTGQQVLFNTGYLPEVVTASGLLPSIYNPLEVKGKLLLDGGIVNNYPIKEVKDLGADIIIGSDVQGTLLNRDEITDLPAIMDQIVSFGMYAKMPLKKANTNIYIRTNIDGIGLTDFDKMDTIISRGETATERALAKYGSLQELHSKWKIKDLHYKKPDSLLFTQIIIEGQNNYKREYILGKIDVKTHRKLSYKDFLEGIDNLYGTDNFEKIHYRFKNEGGLKLYLNVKEKEHKASLNIGFHYNDLYKINIIGNFENKRIFTKNDLVSIDFIAGNHFRYNFDYIIDNGFKMTFGLHSSLHQIGHQVVSKNVFPNHNFAVNQLDFNYLQLSNKIYFQGNLNHFLYLRLGVQHQFKRLYTYVFSGIEKNQAYYFGNNHYFGSFASINFDSRNDFDFPSKGIYLKLKWNYNLFSSDFYKDFKPFSLYTFNLKYTQELIKKIYLHTEIGAGLHYADKHNDENIFYIGGQNNYLNFDNIISFKPTDALALSATKFFKPSLTADYQFFKEHHLFLGGHILYYDTSDSFSNLSPSQVYGFSVGYGFKSFLGPVKWEFGRIPHWQKNTFSFTFSYDF